MSFKAYVWQAPVFVVVNCGENGGHVDQEVFYADVDYEVVAVSEVHTVAGADAGAVTADLKKADSGTAITSGTSVLASTFNMKSTAATPVTKTIANGGISATDSTRIVKAGQHLGIDFTGVITSLAGASFTIVLKPLTRPVYR